MEFTARARLRLVSCMPHGGGRSVEIIFDLGGSDVLENHRVASVSLSVVCWPSSTMARRSNLVSAHLHFETIFAHMFSTPFPQNLIAFHTKGATLHALPPWYCAHIANPIQSISFCLHGKIQHIIAVLMPWSPTKKYWKRTLLCRRSLLWRKKWPQSLFLGTVGWILLRKPFENHTFIAAHTCLVAKRQKRRRRIAKQKTCETHRQRKYYNRFVV